MDAEQVRAVLAVLLWSAGTVTERREKRAITWLGTADTLLRASYEMGHPMSEEPPNLLLTPTQYSAQRFHEWVANVPADVRPYFTPPAP